MSFTDGKPFVATTEDCQRAWSGGKHGIYFRCYLCGHKFKPGDIVRWQYTNNIKGAGGNPMVCRACDGQDVIRRWKELHDDWNSDKFWWFRRMNR